MELEENIIKRFFKYGDKILFEKDNDLYLRLLDIVNDVELYKDLRNLYSLFNNHGMKYPAKAQIEGYIGDKIVEIEVFICEFEDKYPKFAEKLEDKQNKIPFWQSDMESQLKNLELL